MAQRIGEQIGIISTIEPELHLGKPLASAIVNCFPQLAPSIAARADSCQALTAVVDEVGFSVLKYCGKTPVLAVCAQCQLKFLTPSQMTEDWEAASKYLWRKFSDHRCAAAPSRNVEKIHDQPSTCGANTPRNKRPRAIQRAEVRRKAG